MTPQPTSSRFRSAGFLLAVLALAAVGGLKWMQARGLSRETARLRTQVAAGPRVRTLVVRAEGDNAPLALEGETVPIAAVTLYAKLAGFVKEMRVDKGAQVRKGDLLAVLESPETDRQTQSLKVASDNAQATAERLQELGKAGIANRQDVDNAVAAARVAREQWQAQALVQGYERVLAPFAGVVTARMVDPGAFVTNATGTLSAQPILSLADTSRLRVDFFLDQGAAGRARVGQAVEVAPSGRPDLVRSVAIRRLAGTLDARTRTMLAEAELDNHDGLFLGGGYVNVALHLPRGSGELRVPPQVLLMRGNAAFAAAVVQGRVRLLPLALGADVGAEVRVLRGLAGGERIILNPDPGLQEGDPVQLAD